jgi:glycosyltransferase involved in cell wall biosynthesis
VASVRKIIIVNGEKNSATILYRSHAAERCLKRLGLIVDVHEIDSLNNVNLINVSACLFVRTPLTPEVGSFIERLKAANVAMLADFDDLVFRPDLLHLIDGINYLSDVERQQFTERTFQYQEMVKVSDCVVVTTLPLAEKVVCYKKQVRVIRNYPLEVTKNISFNSDDTKHNTNKFVIGYYSGTLTHQADFRQCSNALATLMKRQSDLELRIVGNFNMQEFSEFEEFGPRVMRIPLMSYEDMISDLGGCDLNIAPLEVGNAFCESKSELKYFDAALMRVPTIASPTMPFKAAIRHGTNGYLANTQSDWYNCLDTLLHDKSATKRVGLNARRYVLSFFGEAAMLNDYRGLINFVKCRQ